MRVPLEITFRGLESDTTLERLIESQVEKLEKRCDHLISCRVAIETTQRQGQPGEVHEARVTLRMPPGHELVSRCRSDQVQGRDTLETVVREAFEGARRQIDRQTDKQARQTKRHPHQEVTAFVEQLFREEGYGFLRTTDGRQIYFHRNSLPLDDFDDLQTGEGVTFAATEGDKGLQASTVRVIDSRGAGAAPEQAEEEEQSEENERAESEPGEQEERAS